MSQIVWRCGYCKETIVPEGQFACEKCDDEYVVASQEIRIILSDITYSRQDVALGPTGKELEVRGHIGRRAIACEYMPEELREKIRDFVLRAELARAARREKMMKNDGRTRIR